ncbi:hypothetical protein [Achromobacter pestifer]|uniref:Uncharacterized protein n=1 Tax=Achromobacter pestifer TaxID=1353889 RepID=A0A6S6YPB4_9BURK|nr:hypothetical protein [Achromobacter pestifer]CAB3634736.1 hypothetical protein LMG3431_01418 [Achromobacter pestifer]
MFQPPKRQNALKLVATPLIALGMAFGLSDVALAQNSLPISPLMSKQPESSASWRVSASPYAWASGISGKVGQFGQPPARLDSRFSDIISDVDLAFMGAIEARYDRFSLVGDVMYGQLSAGGDTPYGVLSRRVDIKTTSFSGFFGAGYGVLEGDKGHLDVIGGGRLWHASTKLSLKGGALDGRSERDGATWIDAVAGLRGQYAVGENWYLTGWGVIGAGQAKLDWDATAALAYQFKSNFSAVLGYRALGVNYNRNGFVYDVIQHGPILGLSYQF